MSLQKGTGVKWSIETTFTGTGVYATGIVQSVKYGLDGDQKKIKGADGKTVTRIFSDTIETITIEVIPSGTTLALAKASYVLPARGADITVVDSDDSEIAGSGTSDGTGTYIFISGEKTTTIDGEAVLTMVLERGEKHLATVAAS